MKVLWEETEELLEEGFGHGVEFYIKDEEGNRELVAILEGYEWYHGSPKEVLIKMHKGSELKNPKVFKDIRRDIEKALNEKRIQQGQISSLVYAWLNA